MKGSIKGNWGKIWIVLLVVFMAVGLTACGAAKTGGTTSKGTSSLNGGGSSKKSTLNIKIAWYMPTGTATDKQGNEIAQKIEKESNGSIKVQTYPGGSLLDEKAIGKGLQNNTVQMAIMGLHWWSGQIPATNFDMIPGLAPRDPNQMLTKLHGKLGNDINKLFDQQGVHIVGWGFYGYVGAYVNKKHKIAKPEDLKGLKMRADGSIAAEEMKHFGGIPLNMSSSEVYEALQRGTIEGATSGVASFVSRKWIETCKYMTAYKQDLLVYPVFVNAKWWNSLTKDQQQTISKAVANTEQDNIKAINDTFDNGVKEAKQKGVHVLVIDKDQNADLMKLWDQKTAFMKDYYLKHTGDAGKLMVSDLGK